MAGGKVVPAERARSHLSYYVVMAAILALLALLCCYACYFFISKIRELSGSELPARAPSAPPPPPPPLAPATTRTPCYKSKEQAGYPVHPGVRDTATAMAALCRQLPTAAPPPPPPPPPQGDQVFPGARSPAPRPALASPPPLRAAPEPAAPGKLPPGGPCIGSEAAEAAS